MDLLSEAFHQEWVRFVGLVPRIAMSIVVLVALVVVGRIMSGVVERVVRRTPLPSMHRGFFVAATRWLFTLLGIILALNVLGLRGVAAGLVAGGGFTAVVVGFAFRGIGENFLAGLSLVVVRMFKIGDIIRSGEFEGQVRSIDLRHTHIRAADGRDIFIPSIEIFSKPLVNYTRDGLRRLSFTIGLDYRDDIGRARELLLQTVVYSGRALESPKPGVTIGELGPNFVILNVFFWVDTLASQGSEVAAPTDIMNRCREAVLQEGFTVSSEVTTSVVLTGSGPGGTEPTAGEPPPHRPT